MQHKQVLIILSLTVMLIGCGPSFNVKVDSISTGDHSKVKYVLLSGSDDVNLNDLQFQEYATYIKRAMNERGYVLDSSFENADVAVFLSYGIGDPKDYQSTFAMPTYGQTGVSSSTTYGTVNTYGNYGSYSGTTTYTPSYGVTGYIPITTNRTSYFRFLKLDAVDIEIYKKTKETKKLWTTTVTSRGSSSDLRRVFPILVAAAKDHIGKNTGKQLKITLSENDSRVKSIKNETAKK